MSIRGTRQLLGVAIVAVLLAAVAAPRAYAWEITPGPGIVTVSRNASDTPSVVSVYTTYDGVGSLLLPANYGVNLGAYTFAPDVYAFGVGIPDGGRVLVSGPGVVGSVVVPASAVTLAGPVPVTLDTTLPVSLEATLPVTAELGEDAQEYADAMMGAFVLLVLAVFGLLGYRYARG